MRKLHLPRLVSVSQSVSCCFSQSVVSVVLVCNVFSLQPYISENPEQYHISGKGDAIREGKERPGISEHQPEKPSHSHKPSTPGLRDIVGFCAKLECYVDWRETDDRTNHRRKRNDKTTPKNTGRN